MSVRRDVRSSLNAAFKAPWLLLYSLRRSETASSFLARTLLVATSRMSDGARSPADSAEFLDGGTQIFDLISASSHMLTDLIDNKNKGLSRASAPEELESAVDDFADGDRCVAITLGMCPRVCCRIGDRVESMQDRTRPGQTLSAFSNDPPLLAMHFFALGDELIQLIFRFEFDLEFCNIEILGVVEFPQQRSIDELGNTLRNAPGVLLLGNVEEDYIGWEPAID